jgi:hypothetical protein
MIGNIGVFRKPAKKVALNPTVPARLTTRHPCVDLSDDSLSVQTRVQ